MRSGFMEILESHAQVFVDHKERILSLRVWGFKTLPGYTELECLEATPRGLISDVILRWDNATQDSISRHIGGVKVGNFPHLTVKSAI